MLIPQLLFIVFVLAGMLGAAYGIHIALRARASIRWPSVSGTILKSTIDVSDGSGERTDTYRPVIEYRFHWQGREVSGNLIAFGLKNFYFSREAAEHYFRRYAEGTTVKVHHDPDDVTRTVL